MKLCRGCGQEFPETNKNKRTSLCSDCRKTPWKFYPKPKAWEKSPTGKAYMKEFHLEHKAKYKKMVFDHYGWSCACCGESITEFLSVDHVNNDGHLDRKAHISGARLYQRIVTEQFPSNYQILCMNCNFGKKITGGVCPHLT